MPWTKRIFVLSSTRFDRITDSAINKKLKGTNRDNQPTLRGTREKPGRFLHSSGESTVR